jgi:hypothetical protein
MIVVDFRAYDHIEPTTIMEFSASEQNPRGYIWAHTVSRLAARLCRL